MLFTFGGAAATAAEARETVVKSHVWRPLYVVIGLVALVLVVRSFVVPEDFGIGERGYMYGWHRQGNEQEWKEFPVKYRTTAYCRDCHEEKLASLGASPHAPIECENCHGPALGHPDDPPALAIDRSRDLCLRCHFPLPYPTSGRRAIPGIDPRAHNPEEPCVTCHNPHHPNLEEM